MISGEEALLEKGPLSPPPSLLSPNLFNEWEATRREFRWAAFFFGIGIRRITHCPTVEWVEPDYFFKKYTEFTAGELKSMQRPTHRIMDCIVSNLYRTSPSTEKNPLDAVAKSTACGYAPIMIPSFTDRLFFSPSIAGRSVPCGLCPRLTPANCLPP